MGSSSNDITVNMAAQRHHSNAMQYISSSGSSSIIILTLLAVQHSELPTEVEVMIIDVQWMIIVVAYKVHQLKQTKSLCNQL
jgi:hypothetical protein